MTPSIRVTVSALLAGGVLAVVPVAAAAAPPSTKALQAQVKALQKRVATLTAQMTALQSSVKAAADAANAAKEAAAGANATATGAATKTNCLVNATAFKVWNNFVFADSGGFFMGTGLDLATSSDQPSGYVAAVSPSCVPSVLPRWPTSSAFSASASHLDAGSLVLR
jgi:outer membrane murein-binding lipoprotein Lpp